MVAISSGRGCIFCSLDLRTGDRKAFGSSVNLIAYCNSVYVEHDDTLILETSRAEIVTRSATHFTL